MVSQLTPFATWEEAVYHATTIANRDTRPVCLLRTASRIQCITEGVIRTFSLSDGGSVFIQLFK